MTDDASPLNQELLFEAGKVAFRRGWNDPELVTASDLDELPPSGPPVLLIATAEEITAGCARTVASLTGAGRQLSVVTDSPLPPEIASWLSDEIVDYPDKSQRKPDDDMDTATQRRRLRFERLTPSDCQHHKSLMLAPQRSHLTRDLCT